MNRKEEADMLAVYTDHLLGLAAGAPSRGLPVSARYERIRDLLALADHLHAILAPVQPDPHFRDQLYGQLVFKAQSRKGAAGSRLVPEPGRQARSPRQARTRRVIGAAVGLGSVASVLGLLIAVVLRRRTTHVAAG